MSDDQYYQVRDIAKQLKDVLGMVAEIAVQGSNFLYMARVGVYNRISDELEITFRSGIGIEQFGRNSKAKIQVQLKDGTKRILVLYGEVTFCANTYWMVKLRSATICKETRRAFRQKIQLPLTVTYEGNPYDGCVMEDISLVGTAFLSLYYFAEGMPIKVDAPPLLEGGKGYSLECIIQRRTIIPTKDGPSLFRYGCSYSELDERQEDRLCHDIFNLQTAHMKR